MKEFVIEDNITFSNHILRDYPKRSKQEISRLKMYLLTKLHDLDECYFRFEEKKEEDIWNTKFTVKLYYAERSYRVVYVMPMEEVE